MRPLRAAALALAGSMIPGIGVAGVAPLIGLISNQTQETSPQPASGGSAKPVGTVKAIAGNVMTLTTDAGSTVNVVVQDSTRLVRIAPGEKDLKAATPTRLEDVQVGDRILARGESSDGGKSVMASSVVVMKESDVTAKQEKDREDWQKRGVGGLVSKVDVVAGVITLSAPAMEAAKPVTIHVSKSTIFRRYSPDSVKFDDATPSTLDEIHAGDQLRGRGVRSGDSTELAAEEVVSGMFRNIAGTVASIDASNNTISVLDLTIKKPVTLRIIADSQLRKLPPMIAQRIALRLRGQAPPSGPGQVSPGPASNAEPGPTTPNGNRGGSRPAGSPDFQQMLKRMPAVALADLQKGDAVMIVATQGTASTQPTAITLLSGVEPILSASPNSNKVAMLLSPWNLGGGDAVAGATQ